MKTENIENHNNQSENKKDEQNNSNLLTNQKEESVIDIPEQNEETENTEKQNNQIENKEDEQNNSNLLTNQKEESVIDIPEQNEETELTTKINNKYKHEYIYKQFSILRVYTTALKAFGINLLSDISLNIIIIKIFGAKVISSNQEQINELFATKALTTLIDACIIAPIIEEFIFRSILFKIINHCGKRVQEQDKNLGLAIRVLAFLISSFVFAFGHFGFKFETLGEEFTAFPFYFISGLVLAYAYNRDNYILASIFAHSFMNIASFITLIWG
ncbi:hypothetical protein PIROE2DRAFT_70086 [Piromyces sp. E2]|nr:hypothetical protein PIROE2DRAFT_70086 [Piromyces sp. E2]|eukprot:OUM57323.1 hypothetical protein PIROE2DRAFT_70086 [Piromyces sp. E2]